MTETITAVYEQGMLRPLTPLRLTEHQQVQLRILPEQPADATDAVIQDLISAGIITPPAGRSELAPPSEQERSELAAALGQGAGMPASEIIIEERGAR